MARRNDHSPEALKALLQGAAVKIIASKGLEGLTARSLAKAVGYTPGTIYNVYRDMDALLTDVNFATLSALEAACQSRIEKAPRDFSCVRALAYAYVDFAHQHRHAWETLFSGSRVKARLPKAYGQKLLDLFALIENVLHDCLRVPASEARRAARLLWASLHGITVLTLDGRLSLVGADEPHALIDTLLENYLSDPPVKE